MFGKQVADTFGPAPSADFGATTGPNTAAASGAGASAAFTTAGYGGYPPARPRPAHEHWSQEKVTACDDSVDEAAPSLSGSTSTRPMSQAGTAASVSVSDQSDGMVELQATMAAMLALSKEHAAVAQARHEQAEAAAAERATDQLNQIAALNLELKQARDSNDAKEAELTALKKKLGVAASEYGSRKAHEAASELAGVVAGEPATSAPPAAPDAAVASDARVPSPVADAPASPDHRKPAGKSSALVREAVHRSPHEERAKAARAAAGNHVVFLAPGDKGTLGGPRLPMADPMDAADANSDPYPTATASAAAPSSAEAV